MKSADAETKLSDAVKEKAGEAEGAATTTATSPAFTREEMTLALGSAKASVLAKEGAPPATPDTVETETETKVLRMPSFGSITTGRWWCGRMIWLQA